MQVSMSRSFLKNILDSHKVVRNHRYTAFHDTNTSIGNMDAGMSALGGRLGNKSAVKSSMINPPFDEIGSTSQSLNGGSQPSDHQYNKMLMRMHPGVSAPKSMSMNSQSSGMGRIFRRRGDGLVPFDDETGADFNDITDGANVLFNDLRYLHHKGISSIPIIPTIGLPTASLPKSNGPMNNSQYRKYMNLQKKIALAQGSRSNSLAGSFNHMLQTGYQGYDPRLMLLMLRPNGQVTQNFTRAQGGINGPRTMLLQSGPHSGPQSMLPRGKPSMPMYKPQRRGFEPGPGLAYLPGNGDMNPENGHTMSLKNQYLNGQAPKGQYIPMQAHMEHGQPIIASNMANMSYQPQIVPQFINGHGTMSYDSSTRPSSFHHMHQLQSLQHPNMSRPSWTPGTHIPALLSSKYPSLAPPPIIYAPPSSHPPNQSNDSLMHVMEEEYEDSVNLPDTDARLNEHIIQNGTDKHSHLAYTRPDSNNLAEYSTLRPSSLIRLRKVNLFEQDSGPGCEEESNINQDSHQRDAKSQSVSTRSIFDEEEKSSGLRHSSNLTTSGSSTSLSQVITDAKPPAPEKDSSQPSSFRDESMQVSTPQIRDNKSISQVSIVADTTFEGSDSPNLTFNGTNLGYEQGLANKSSRISLANKSRNILKRFSRKTLDSDSDGGGYNIGLFQDTTWSRDPNILRNALPGSDKGSGEPFLFSKEEMRIMNCNRELLEELLTVTLELAASIKREIGYENKLRKDSDANTASHSDQLVHIEGSLANNETLVILQTKLNKEKQLRFISEEHAILLENGQSPLPLKLSYEKTEMYQQLLVKNQQVGMLEERVDELSSQISGLVQDQHSNRLLMEKYMKLKKENEELKKENKELKYHDIHNIDLNFSRDNLSNIDETTISTLTLQRNELRQVVAELSLKYAFELKECNEKVALAEAQLREMTRSKKSLQNNIAGERF